MGDEEGMVRKENDYRESSTRCEEQHEKNGPQSVELSGTDLCRPGGKGLAGSEAVGTPDRRRGEELGRVTLSVR